MFKILCRKMKRTFLLIAFIVLTTLPIFCGTATGLVSDSTNISSNLIFDIHSTFRFYTLLPPSPKFGMRVLVSPKISLEFDAGEYALQSGGETDNNLYNRPFSSYLFYRADLNYYILQNNPTASSCLISCEQFRDNKTKTDVKPTVDNTMNDIEKLLDITMPFVEELLKNHGEFFPLASAVMTNDSIAPVATYDGNERPLSDNLIVDFKEVFRANKDDYKTIAIFYDVRVNDPDTKVNTDAVAVFIESKNDYSAFKFYYPYTLTKDKPLTFSNPWKTTTPKEIFID
jgi:hypothetical protein